MNGFAPPPHPSGWKEVKTDDGKAYYHNTLTNATTWTKPDELMTDLDRALVGSPWKEYKTPDGRAYWHNPQTNETTWELPSELAEKIKNVREAQPPQKPAAPPPTGWAAGPTSLPPYDQRPHGRDGRDGRDDYQLERRDREREANYGADRPAASFGSSTEIMFSNPQDAEDAFNNLLKKLKVQSDWTWPQTVRVGIKDSHWRAIPDPKERELAFNRYCDDLRAQEKAKEQERQVKLKSDFGAMLQSHPEITHCTRWKTALPMIRDESIFKAAKDDTERRALFEEYIISLKRLHVEEEVEGRKTALDELAKLLQTLDLEPFTRWHVAEEQLETNDEFQSKKFQVLGKVDVLTTFKNHVKELQQEQNDRVQAKRREDSRIERKNRDAFKELLRELQVNGRLKFDSKWKDVHELINDDPRYLAMLGQRGSTPLELFWDSVEEEEGKFRTQRRYALDVLDKQRFEVTPDTPLKDFIAVMRMDPRTANLDEHLMKAILEYIVNRVKEREEAERNKSEHSERRAMDDLRSILKHLEPPMSVGDNWEDVRPRIEKTAEFRALKSDSLRQSVFDRYLRRLEDKKRDKERDRERDRDRDRDRDRERDRERDRDRERERDRDRNRRDPRDRERDRRDRGDREYRNGHSDAHRRHRTRTRSPEHDSYAAERRQAQQDREARYKNNESTGLSPPYRRNRDDDRHERPRRGSGDHYGRERREREVERERTYVSRADPLERSVSELDYGDSRPVSARRRRESGDSAGRRDAKRPRYSPRERTTTKTPPAQVPVDPKDDPGLRSGSEEGEIEED